jgi:DNA-binding winged helix-turn-helix (wHTH) protein
MTDLRPARRYRFGVFEADAITGELRKHGVRIRLNSQPFQMLCMLLERQGELLTRDEICRELWPEGTFVDYEHGVNSAVNRIREALGDKANNPRFVETLARRGYRFVAPVEHIAVTGASSSVSADSPGISNEQKISSIDETRSRNWILASPRDLPEASYRLVQVLFLLLQCMYLGFYVGALANLAEIESIFAVLPKATHALIVLMSTAAILIPVRAFLLCASLFHAPGIRNKFLRIWPFLLVFDLLWSLAPFLLLHHINYGLALACMTLLVYSPFAQRSLILMGAGEEPS